MWCWWWREVPTSTYRFGHLQEDGAGKAHCSLGACIPGISGVSNRLTRARSSPVFWGPEIVTEALYLSQLGLLTKTEDAC
jgi:hypothetical protein